MSNFWLDKKKERVLDATKKISIYNFEEIIKAVLNKHTLTYFAGSPDYIVSEVVTDKIIDDSHIPDIITFGPSGPTIIEICQSEYNSSENSKEISLRQGSYPLYELELSNCRLLRDYLFLLNYGIE